jgi:nitroreductase
MNFLELANLRRSVRDYLEKPVEPGLLATVLEAGRIAPSACNNQPLVFIVVDDEEARAKLEPVYPRQWFVRAPVIIAVCCDRTQSWHRSDDKDYGDIDAAIALDHMTLAAAELGLGTCWIGAFNPGEARKVLMLPPKIDPIAFTPLGYPGPRPALKRTRKSLDELVFRNFYGGK